MTYEDFLQIPVTVLRELETMFLIKSKYSMDLTAEEKKICEHIETLCDERTKSLELSQKQQQLEKLFTK